ncbi:MAG: anti-sigma factor [Gloeocapsa sp. UFS-A4-WI-NPMV-4B04]|jgi:anti-sigma-K factor RskA|nr:anti-sigma factor [Gloeocapsa sp. UFS-A4-WI-NPMV-4B04]
MFGSPSPEHLEELIAGYVLGNLCSEEAEEFKHLLAEKPELIQQVNQLQEVLGLLPYALPEIRPPQHLRLAIVEAVNDPVNPKLARKQFVLPWSKIVASVAAIFTLALGIDSYRLRQELSSAKDVLTVLDGRDTHLYSVKGKDKKSPAFGSVLIDFDADKAAIALNNISSPPTGQSYWLWAVVNDRIIRCGQFNVGTNGFALDKISVPDDAYKEGDEISKLLVTLESSESPSYPSEQIVIVSAS